MDVILPDQLPGFIAERDRVAAATVLEPAVPDLVRFSQQLRALSSLNARLICMEADHPVYGEMVRGISRILNIDMCALFMREPAGAHLVLEGIAGAARPAGRCLLGLDELQRPAVQAFLEEYLVHVPDTDSVQGAQSLVGGHRSLLAMPIMGREGPVGAFEFARRAAGGFATAEIDLATMLVDQMSYQLENYRLVRQLSTSRDAVIHGMARLAESRGGNIGGHLDRICAYSQRLARTLQGRPGYVGVVTDEWIATLTRAAALHDIGKVGIPDRILLKPGALDEDEFEVMRTHARLGGEILQDLMVSHGTFPMLEMGMEVALGHHERWDGSGYPNGVGGKRIPLSARIVAVTDVYDALTSARVYKAAWSQKDTIAQVLGLAGSHFDPDLVRAFLQDTDELLQIQRRFPD
ncbi:MAG TPA: HD domain-containing protein [Candidatus Krumholzibacteria bacterium]|nr:HD domain-containing protein [Candidatus Krumholzibacteria bacterium]HPD71956.1 HD domain-containing protein [Candidatus Krumholzibacteria bacterium]HRY41111.1 HD domain-containing protein [Candidatus Krumholzibacteria bacterium]